MTWRPVTRDTVMDVAGQPDVDHRILTGGVAIDGDTEVRIHTASGINEPVLSRYLHSYGVHLEVQAVRVDPLGADFLVPDHKATLDLTLGIGISLAVLVPLIILASSYHGILNGPIFACPPSNPAFSCNW